MTNRLPDVSQIPIPGKAGLPRVIDANPDTIRALFRLGKIQATVDECAAVLGVGKGTIYRLFEAAPETLAAYENGKAQGRRSLRRAQMKAALRGNPTMLIWMGKQILEQRDQADVNFKAEVNVTETKTIRYSMTDDELLAIASSPVDTAGSRDGTVEAPESETVPRRLQ